MATLAHMDGLDLGGTFAELMTLGGYRAVSTSSTSTYPAGSAWGTQSVGLNSSARGFCKRLPSTASWYHLGMAVKWKGGNAYSIMNQGDTVTTTASALNCCVSLYSSGQLALVGDGATRAVTTEGVMPQDTWAWLELIFQYGSSGNARLYLNGVEVLNVNADFADGNSNAAYAMFGYCSATPNIEIDDIFAYTSATDDFTVLGEWRIETLLPDGDTAQADWTGSYADIDDPLGALHDGDTSFITSDTLNHASEFSLGNLSSGVEAVKAVKLTSLGKKTATGMIAYTPYLSSGGVVGNGASPALTEAYTPSSTLFETDPNGGGSWTKATVDALLLGVKVTG